MAKSFFHNKVAVISVGIILIIALMAVFAPFLTPYEAERQDLLSRLKAPGNGHLFGTDELGRDVFARMLYGSRISLLIAIIPTALAVFAGMVMGIVSAYYGKAADLVIMWLADVTLAFPGMLLAMAIMYTFGGSFTSVLISIIIMEWGSIARIVRSVTMSIIENEYVQAARTMGVRKISIIIKHVLPNLMPTLIVLFTLNVPSSILSESALSFLGIGIQPPEVSLGLMVNQSKALLFQMPWLALAPSIMIMILVLVFNYLGDALRDILDPKTKY
ncbi:ABC transporter permease [Butyrivibrio sp. AE3006]|uniref:ABC transporter permease n=1 Tax=Butyrivibrio sp. AE3006 TaxID=1280673 RepID=UPI000683EC49|nr:ABC transporter permease [Butyrivibrio sp. AE3006]